MIKIDDAVSTEYYGKEITAAMVMIGVVITASIIAIIKMLTSSRGKVKLGDLTFQWGK